MTRIVFCMDMVALAAANGVVVNDTLFSENEIGQHKDGLDKVMR